MNTVSEESILKRKEKVQEEWQVCDPNTQGLMRKDRKFRQHELHSEIPYKSSNDTEQKTKSIIYTT